nr:MAG TPA: hypothetical protein [Inoviridae sp.]
MMSLVRAQLGEPRMAVGFISYSFFRNMYLYV